MAREDWQPSDRVTPFLLRASDRLYDEVARAIQEGRLDARNPIADAALDYRDSRDEGVRSDTTEGVR
jgi:hypothetical protein